VGGRDPSIQEEGQDHHQHVEGQDPGHQVGGQVPRLQEGGRDPYQHVEGQDPGLQEGGRIMATRWEDKFLA
jgi:hypothetical protein